MPWREASSRNSSEGSVQIWDASAIRQREQAAIEALREAIELLDRATGDHAEFLIEILDDTSFVEDRAGMRTDAFAHSKRAADMRTEKYGPNSAEAAVGLAHLAMKHATYKEYEKAEALPAMQFEGNRAEAKKYAELAQDAVPPRQSKD